MARENGRAVAIAGATGLVGRALLEGLLVDRRVAQVHALGRRAVPTRHAKLTSHVVDFATLQTLPPVDEVYLALGTTLKAAGSQAAFRAVDFDANLAVARAAVGAGAQRCGLVSAMGANARSLVFYSRVKGELEEALGTLPFAGLVIVRPSLLVGERVALGQPERPGERRGLLLSRLLGPLVPADYRPVAASKVARELLTRVPSASGRVVVPSGAMQA